MLNMSMLFGSYVIPRFSSVFRYEKQARNTPRRARTNLKKQPIRGQVLKSHCYESDALNMSRSF